MNGSQHSLSGPSWYVPVRVVANCFMMTSSNGNIFRVTGPLCGEFTGPGEFPTQRPVTRSFDVFFDLRLNKRLNKQSRGWWFETLSRPFWRHRNVWKQLNTLRPKQNGHHNVNNILDIFPRQQMYYIDGLVHDCSISIAKALEILQPCTKPSTYRFIWTIVN